MIFYKIDTHFSGPCATRETQIPSAGIQAVFG